MIRSRDRDCGQRDPRAGRGGRLGRLARAAGRTRFVPASPIWGNAQITGRGQTRFFLGLPHQLPNRHRAYALQLLRTVVMSRRWGIGTFRLPGWRLHFMGAWGLGTGRIDHQAACSPRAGDASPSPS
jgi:hypothetical protein